MAFKTFKNSKRFGKFYAEINPKQEVIVYAPGGYTEGGDSFETTRKKLEKSIEEGLCNVFGVSFQATCKCSNNMNMWSSVSSEPQDNTDKLDLIDAIIYSLSCLRQQLKV